MASLELANSSTIDYYNDHAEEYFLNSKSTKLCRLYDTFLNFLPSGGLILDAGCGSGRDTKYFLSLGYKVIAIDASEEMARLSSQFTGHKTIQMDFYDLDFEQQSFDGIWALASLLHIPKKDIDHIIGNFSDILKTDGVFCMSFKEGIGERLEEGRFFNDYTESEFRTLMAKQSSLEIKDLWLGTDSLGRTQRWITALLRKI
jgi:SAM-dependent methyltransferase